jgi:hypothetical protein
MLSNFKKRQVEASRIARGILADYFDYESASDRVLEFCDGQRWLAQLVDKELRRLTDPHKQRKAA